MIIHYVRFTTSLSKDEVQQIMEDRAPSYREVPGLLQKYYGYDESSGAYCGCYIFDSMESREAFRQTDLARTVAEAYQAEDLRVERYDVLFPLYEQPVPPK